MAENLKSKRVTREIIRDTIKKEHTLDRSHLTYVVADTLVERYDDAHLESQLKKIGLMTTKNIHEALDEYILKHRKQLEKEGLTDEQ